MAAAPNYLGVFGEVIRNEETRVYDDHLAIGLDRFDDVDRSTSIKN
jgi:hypothetical protein